MRSVLSVIVLAAVAFAIVVVAAPAPVHASDARTDALGIQREYLEDYILFRSFPTVAARYQNLVTASLGERNLRDRSVGVIGSGSGTGYGVFAIYLNDLGSDGGQDAQIDLTWAKQFDGTALGASVNWTSSGQETGAVERTPIGGHSRFNLAANQLSFTGGVKIDLADTDQLEAAAELAWLTWNDEQNGTEDAGNLSYRFAARLMNEVSSKTTLVPLAQFSRVDLTGEGDPDDTVFNTLNLGVAAHHQVNGNDLLILGVAANYLNRKTYTEGLAQSTDFSRWDLPALFIALEFGIYDWLTGRVGATKTLDVSNLDTGTSSPETDTTNSRYFFGLGMGIHFDHFDVDATVNPDAVFTGGYLFSGTSSNPLARITGTYYF